MMDIGMYGGEHYQVGEMASTSSTYNYYPNYHNHSHLHHHHMHHNPTAEILSGFSAQSHAPNQTAPVINSTNHSLSLYHEYGITMSNPEQTFYDSDSGMAQMYYPNQSNQSSDHHGISSSSHQTTPTSVSSSSNDILPETAPSHIISSDNGLSYTNLDYMYSSGHSNPLYLHQPDDKSAIPHPYNHTSPTSNLESSLHPQQHSSMWQSQHPSSHASHSHHPPGYLENPVNAHQISVGQVACIQNQTPLGAGSNGIHARTLNNRTDQITSQQNSQNQPQHGQTVQTYKWMQVKRNVPKPQGKIRTTTSLLLIKIQNMKNY